MSTLMKNEKESVVMYIPSEKRKTAEQTALHARYAALHLVCKFISSSDLKSVGAFRKTFVSSAVL